MSDTAPDQERTTGGAASIGELATRLSRSLSLLVRIEVEQAAARHATSIRWLRRELALAVLAAAALLLAVLFASWGVVRLLDASIRPWLAALSVAAGWLLVAVLSLTALVRRFAGPAPAAALASRLDGEKARAEADAAATVEALTDELAERVAHHEEARLTRAAQGEIGHLADELEDGAATLITGGEEVEERTATALEELVEIITLPGRAGIDTVRRLLS